MQLENDGFKSVCPPHAAEAGSSARGGWFLCVRRSRRLNLRTRRPWFLRTRKLSLRVRRLSPPHAEALVPPHAEADEEAYQLSYLQKHLGNIVSLLADSVDGEAEDSLLYCECLWL